MRKYNPNKGYKNDWIDFNMDGMSKERRIKGKDKKYMQRLTRNRIDKETENQIRGQDEADKTKLT